MIRLSEKSKNMNFSPNLLKKNIVFQKYDSKINLNSKLFH